MRGITEKDRTNHVGNSKGQGRRTRVKVVASFYKTTFAALDEDFVSKKYKKKNIEAERERT